MKKHLTDTLCTIHPYFRVHDGKLVEFKTICQRLSDITSSEPGCVFYSFTFMGSDAHCREGYIDANAILVHLENVQDLLGDMLAISDRLRLEIHGPCEELEKLSAPLAQLKPGFYSMEVGFRK